MKTKSQTLKRLLALHNAARTIVVTEKDRRPKINLERMSKRFVFITAQEKRGLTGSLINVDVFARLMSIARSIIVVGGAAALIACCLAASFSIDAAVRVAIVLLIGGAVVWYRVLGDIDSLFNFDNLVDFMAHIDRATELLNPPEAKDLLAWLRYSHDDLCVNTATAVDAALNKNQLDEAKRQIELFVTLGLVTGQPLNKFKQRLQAAQSTPATT